MTCLQCGRPADGRLRAAFWEEEEKGRLAARSATLCVTCHADFLAGRLSRVTLAERAHAARGYRPAEWIGRIDRDALLDIACLQCGILLPVGIAAPDAAASRTAAPAASLEVVTCPRCGAENRFAERTTVAGRAHVSASLRDPYQESAARA